MQINNETWNRIFIPNWNHINAVSDTEWYSEIGGETLILSFQGSGSKLDWFQNFNFWVKPYHNMDKIFMVHSGFLKKYKSVRDEIIKLVCNSEDTIKIIEVYGFSQGAALATLCVEDMEYMFPEKSVSGIVYGSPRVVSFFGAKEFDSRINLLRVEAGNDAVTKLPPFLLFYKHVGTKLHIGEKKKRWKFSIKQHTGQYYKECSK